jgi:Family of unknown function (DUF5678)
MVKQLLNTDKYNGKYVALKSHEDSTVISSSDSPTQVLETARKLGVENPVIVYVPSAESVHIY